MQLKLCAANQPQAINFNYKILIIDFSIWIPRPTVTVSRGNVEGAILQMRIARHILDNLQSQLLCFCVQQPTKSNELCIAFNDITKINRKYNCYDYKV